MGADFTLETAEFVAGLNLAQQRTTEGAGNGLSKLADAILTAAKAAVPKDSGELAASGTTAVDFGAMEAAVGFGSGASAANAIVQHERMDYAHDDGHAKYLEIPLVTVGVGEGAAIIAAAIGSALG